VCKYTILKVYRYFVIYLLFNEDSIVEYSAMTVGTLMGKS